MVGMLRAIADGIIVEESSRAHRLPGDFALPLFGAVEIKSNLRGGKTEPGDLRFQADETIGGIILKVNQVEGLGLEPRMNSP